MGRLTPASATPEDDFAEADEILTRAGASDLTKRFVLVVAQNRRLFALPKMIRAFLAGSDLLLMPADPTNAVQAVTEAVANGRITMARLDASVERVLRFKQRMGLFEQREVDTAAVRRIVASDSFTRIAESITERSLVLLKDTDNLVGNLRNQRGAVALVSVADGSSTLGTALAGELKAQGFTIHDVRIPTEPSQADLARAHEVIARAPVTVLATAVRWGSYSGTIGLKPATASMLEGLVKRQPTVLISFGSPYVVGQVPSTNSYLIAWSATEMAERAVARALAGATAISGTAPIAIPPGFPIRTGIQLGITQ